MTCQDSSQVNVASLAKRVLAFFTATSLVFLLSGLLFSKAHADDDVAVPPPPSIVDRQYEFLSQQQLPSLSSDAAETVTRISLLFLYEPTLPDPIQTIEDMLSETNQFYAASNVHVEYISAAIVPFDTGGGTNGDVLRAITTGQFTDDVEAIRDLYSGDMVTYIRPYDGGTGCGRAWLIGSGFTPSASYTKRYSKSIVMTGRSGGFFCSSNTLAHELGHNFGAVHDLGNTSLAPRFPYGYGYGIDGDFGTIMSYIRPEVGVFSNPNLTTCQGVPCGISDQADVTRAINEVRHQYSSIYPDLPSAPTISSIEPAVDSLSISFAPAASEAAQIQEFSATCGDVSTSGESSPIVVAGLQPDQSYECTVFASNNFGDGPESSPVSTRTNPVVAPTIISVSAGDEEITLTVEPHSIDGSYSVTGYTASCGLLSATSSSTNITVTGLTNDTEYSCTVSVTTSVGASQNSSAVTATPTFVSSGLNILLIKAMLDGNAI